MAHGQSSKNTTLNAEAMVGGGGLATTHATGRHGLLVSHPNKCREGAIGRVFAGCYNSRCPLAANAKRRYSGVVGHTG